MTMVEVKCPQCGEIRVSKFGKSENGEQRYICNVPECPMKTFRLEYRYEGAKPGTDEKIVSMTANASGIRDTSRVLGVSTGKVMRALKKRLKSSAQSTFCT
jgi:transposase-like protein